MTITSTLRLSRARSVNLYPARQLPLPLFRLLSPSLYNAFSLLDILD